MSRPTAIVLRALGLGDLLTAVPALRALRRALPDHRIVLATPAHLAVVLDDGLVDDVSDTSGLRPLPPRAGRPDVAVDLHGSGPQSHRILRTLEPRRLVCFANAECGESGPSWLAHEHERVRWCRLVAESLGVPADPDDFRLAPPTTPTDVSAAIVIHPGASHESRRWPVSRWAEVAAALAADGEPVVVTGSDGEVARAEQVAAAAGLPGSAVLAGRTDVRALAALVAGARLVISGDTGIAHLAAAYATSSVVLFGPTPPALWGPPANGPHTVVWRPGGVRPPNGDAVDPALLRIEASEIVDAARRRMHDGVGGTSMPSPPPSFERRRASWSWTTTTQ